MTTIESIATTIVIAAAVGGFIDFYIGKAGQVRIRDSLQVIWVNMSYMTLNDIARTESHVAAKAIAWSFGSRLFSLRKFLTVSFVFLALLAIALFFSAVNGKNFNADQWGMSFGFSLPDYTIYLIRISITLSISLAIAKKIASANIQNPWFGATSLLVLLIAQLLLILSPYAVEAHFGSAGTPLHEQLKLFLAKFYPFDYDGWAPEWVIFFVDLLLQPLTIVWGMALSTTDLASLQKIPKCGYLMHATWTPYVSWGSTVALPCAELLLNLSRLGLFLAFALTLALYPLRNFLSTILIRLIESDKPVYTLVLTGIAAFVKAVQEAVKLI